MELSYKQMLSKTKNVILSDEEYELILKSRPWMEKLESILKVYDKSIDSAKYLKELLELANKNGSFEDIGKRKIYHSNNQDKIILIIVDHMGLVSPQTGKSLKMEMDEISKISVQFRNRCNFSFLMIMQANRESANVERRKLDLVSPQRSDIKDSSNMEADSDLILAVFNPHKEKLPKHQGYDIQQLKAKFRGIYLLKSRYGDGDVSVGCNFFGKTNYWHELPKASEIYNYDKYLTLDTYNTFKKDNNENEDLYEEGDKSTCVDGVNNFNIIL